MVNILILGVALVVNVIFFFFFPVLLLLKVTFIRSLIPGLIISFGYSNLVHPQLAIAFVIIKFPVPVFCIINSIFLSIPLLELVLI